MNGVLVIDKPPGKTSHDIVDEVRKSLGVRKAGHTGTLDPLATGVLPVCINEATKLMPFFSLDDKDYRAVMLLGVETDTLDTEGSITLRREPSVSEEEIIAAVLSFRGEIDQIPPRYSAIKHRGKALYKWARSGVAIDPPPRRVDIRAIRTEDVALPYVTFSVSCSKGTYVRSLCADIGKKLRCGACLASLRRTRSGIFGDDQAMALDGLRDCGKARIISMVDALPQLVSIDIDAPLAEKIRTGYQPACAVLKGYHIPFLAAGDVVKFTLSGHRLVAVGTMLCSSEDLKYRDGKEPAAKITRVFDD